MERRDPEPVDVVGPADVNVTDALAARTRALVEESRLLLERLERLLGRTRPEADAVVADVAVAGGEPAEAGE